MAGYQTGEAGTEMIVQMKNISQNIMKTKLYAVILLALTLAGSGFAQASRIMTFWV